MMLRSFPLGSVALSFFAMLAAAPGNAQDLYIGNGANTIAKVTPGGVTSVFYSGAGLSFPEGLAFDSTGNLYAANVGSNSIEKFTPGGVGSVFASGAGLNAPTFLAFRPTAPVPEASTTASLGLLLALGLGGLVVAGRRKKA